MEPSGYSVCAYLSHPVVLLLDQHEERLDRARLAQGWRRDRTQYKGGRYVRNILHMYIIYIMYIYDQQPQHNSGGSANEA